MYEIIFSLNVQADCSMGEAAQIVTASNRYLIDELYHLMLFYAR